jgi:hypothetical protein
MNTQKHKYKRKTTKDQTTGRHCDEGGGTAGGLDSPGEEVAGEGCCSKREGHAPARGAHVLARAVQTTDHEVSLAS